MRSSAIGLFGLLAIGCAATSGADVATDEHASTEVSTTLSKACSAALDDAEAASAASADRPRGSGYIDVFASVCRHGEGGEASSASCSPSVDAAIDPSLASAESIARHQTYRDVTFESHALDSLVTSPGSQTKLSFDLEVTAFPSVHLRVTEPSGKSLPRDLALVDGATKVELYGDLRDGNLTLRRTGNVRTNADGTVTCARVVLRASVSGG